MSQELVPSDREMWRFIQKYFDGDTSIAPYVQEIFLMDSHIAGTSHLSLEEIEPDLEPGDPCYFAGNRIMNMTVWPLLSSTGRKENWVTSPGEE